MPPGLKLLTTIADRPSASITAFHPELPESQEEMNLKLVELLGEVIRMSQAWVRALESGDPFTADNCEAECVRAMERFEANRLRPLSGSKSLEQTR
jgi:hypothetical protein